MTTPTMRAKPPHTPPQRRTDDAEELAFYHTLPSKFWEEVVRGYQLGASLDVAAGDGSLALTAVRHRLPYTGFVVTTRHRDLTMARLLDVLSAGALQAGDKWYDPSLVKTLVAAAEKKNDEETGQEPAKKKPRQEKGIEGADLNTDATKKRPKTSKTRAKTAKKTQQAKAKKDSESNSEGSDDPGSEGSSGDWDSWASTA